MHTLDDAGPVAEGDQIKGAFKRALRQPALATWAVSVLHWARGLECTFGCLTLSVQTCKDRK